MSYTIAIDFDGTIVTHEYPHIGKPVPNAIEVIKKLKQAGCTLILLTMRGEKNYLPEAKKYCNENGLEFDFFNCNPNQLYWSSSEKVYYEILIDDAAFGCPLTSKPEFSNRRFVDWFRVEEGLLKEGVI